VLFACLNIVPIVLLHCLRASDVEIGVTGLRSLVNLSLMWFGFRAWLLAASGRSLVVVLHSLLSLSNRPICLRPALSIGGLICVIDVVSCLGFCIGQLFVVMSWYSWIVVMTCDVAKSIWSVVVVLCVSGLVSV
jgi:hypothetical protein